MSRRAPLRGEIGEIGAGKAGREDRDRIGRDAIGEPDLAQVHVEDRRAAAAVGTVDGDLTIEAPGAQQCRVEDLGPVGSRQQHDAAGAVEIAYQQVLEPNGNTENARSRNWERWPGSGGMANDNPELATIAYIRDFIQRRITYLDSKIASLPQ